MTMPSYQQIAMRSYLIWEEEGRPHGQDVDHWLQAETELTALFNPPPRSPDGRARKASTSRAKTPARKKVSLKGKGKTSKSAALQH